jgi:hypothetical protein
MRRLPFLVAAAAAAVVTAGAAAALSPSPGVMLGGDGVLASAGDVRYVAVATADATVAMTIRTSDGRVLRTRPLPGVYGVPLVAQDGTADGLARNGATLVLGQSIAPGAALPRETSFAVLGTKTLGLKRLVTLRGAFSFDALSPDARTLYVIQHLSARDITHYAVRAYDLRTNRLLPGAIVDKREPDEEMNGYPLRRATSADGRWAYTLYSRGEGAPFVHALDTMHRAAFCIDLPASVDALRLARAQLEVASGGRQVVIGDAVGRLFTIETGTWKVTAA